MNLCRCNAVTAIALLVVTGLVSEYKDANQQKLDDLLAVSISGASSDS